MTNAPVSPSQPRADETRQDAPWSGDLSADLRRGSLSVSADGLAVIDAEGVCWSIVFPDKSGSYDHVPLIVEAVNSHASLKARIQELERVLREARRYIDPDGDPTALKASAMRDQIDTALAAPQPASNAYALEEPAILEMAKMIDCEAWVAIQDGRDTNAGSMWHLRRDWAKRKAHAIAASLPDLLSLPSTHSAPAAKHSGTFLGYRDEHGNEMHCANAFCPHQDKCHKGCVAPVAMTSTDGKSP